MKENKGKRFKVILFFVILIVIIFLMAVSLSWKKISRLFFPLGLGPPIGIMAVQEFTYTIPSSQLSPGKVVGYYSFANDTSGNWNTTNTTPEMFSTFTVIYPENITDIHIENEINEPNGTIQHGHQFYVSFNITNKRTSDVTRRYIVEVFDPEGIVVQPIVSSRTTVNPGKEEEIDVSYVAEKVGTYTAKVFVWTDWASSGFPIAYGKTISFNSV
jgi:hypothetical protein